MIFDGVGDWGVGGDGGVGGDDGSDNDDDNDDDDDDDDYYDYGNDDTNMVWKLQYLMIMTSIPIMLSPLTKIDDNLVLATVHRNKQHFALSRWAYSCAHASCQHLSGVCWFLPRIEESLRFTTPKQGHTWLRNFKELSACFEPFFLIQTCRTHCMCAACRSSESSPSVWSLSISISSTAQHWDSSPTCSKWPPSGSWHSWGSNTRSTRSQCCIWYDWPSALTSYTGIIIWYQRQGFGLVPVVSNRSHSNSSDQEINIWATQVEIWCATMVRSGPHSIHHLHHTAGPTHQEAWSDFPSICRRYPALFSI